MIAKEQKIKMKNTELTVPILIVTPPDINVKPKEKSETLSENSIRIKSQLGIDTGEMQQQQIVEQSIHFQSNNCLLAL